jgi:hypothetical protein
MPRCTALYGNVCGTRFGIFLFFFWFSIAVMLGLVHPLDIAATVPKAIQPVFDKMLADEGRSVAAKLARRNC